MTPTIPLEDRLADITANVVDIADFNERVVGAYNSGLAERGLPADYQLARSIVPAATGALRDFSYIAPEIPEFVAENCVGCMECVTQCPDTAILGKVAEPAQLEAKLGMIGDEPLRSQMDAQWVKTTKYFTVPEKGAWRREVRNFHRSHQMQRMRGMRFGVRRPRSADDDPQDQ